MSFIFISLVSFSLILLQNVVCAFVTSMYPVIQPYSSTKTSK